MSKLYFKVGSDWQEVVRLRNEITKLEAQIKSMDANKAPQAVAVLNTQMQQAKQQMQGMITEAAKAGAVMDNDFKQKIFEASQGVNSFTEKIIAQKAVVKDVEADVKRLGEAYRSALKNNPLSANSKLSEYTSAKKTLNEEKAALFGLTQEQANARLSVKKLRDEYTLFKDDSQKIVTVNEGVGVSFKKILAGIGGVAAIKHLGSEIINIRGQFRSMEVSLNTMIGETKAKPLLTDIKQYAALSPLQLKDVSSATEMMIGFNIEAEKTPRFIRAIGDISRGESQKFNSLTLAFSQMSAAGKLMGQDLNQMINAGFNPLQIISEKTGKSIAQLKDEMSKGAISAEMVQQAFIDVTSEGGKFYKMSENASKEMAGQMSMLQDAIDSVFNEIGQNNEGAIVKGIQMTTKLVENYETVGRVLTGLVGVYGTYRTALILNAVVEQGFNKAIWANVSATKAYTAAQVLLQKVLKLNPYIAIGSAVVSLGLAFWALADHTTAAEKAQANYNKRKEEAAQVEDKHKQEIEKLITTAQNEYSSSIDRVDALNKLKDAYPGIIQKYIDEEGHLKDILGLKKEIAEIDSRKIIEDTDSIVTDYQSRIKTLQDEIAFRHQNYGNGQYKNPLLQSKTTNQLEKELKQLEEDVKPYAKDQRQNRLNQWQIDLKKETDAKIKTELDEAKRLQAMRKNNPLYTLNIMEGSLRGQISGEELNTRIDVLQSELDLRSPKSETKNKAYWEKKKKEAEAARDALGVEKQNSKDWNEYSMQIKEAQKNIDKYSDSKTTKQENQAEKLRKESEKYKLFLDKNKRIQDRAEVDAQNEITQSIIDAMENGSAKTLAQRELNHKKEIEAIRREGEDRKQQLIDGARTEFQADPVNKKRSFDLTEFLKNKSVQDQFKRIDEQTANKLGTKNTKYVRGDDMVELLDEYKDYTDKRLIIEKKFNDDIAVLQEQRKQAEKSGNTGQVERIDRSIAQATKDIGKSLMGLDYEKLKQSPEYVRAFENLRQTSTETLNSLLSQFENAKQSAAQVLSPDQLREYTTTIQSIMDELDERNPFQALADRKKELADAENELAEAKRQLDLVNDGGKIVTGVKNSKLEKGKISFENTYLSSADALKKYNEAKDKAAKASNRYQKAEKEVADVVDKLFTSIKDVGSTIGGTSGEVLSFIGDIGLFVTSSINAWETAASAGSKAVQAVEKASVILAVISTVIQLMEKLSSLSKSAYEQYEAFAEKVKEINLLTDAVNEYRIAALEAQQVENNWFSKDNLQNLRDYRKLHEEVAKAYKDKAEEDQATYQNQKGGGWLTGGLNGIMNWLSPLGWSGMWQKWTNQNYKEGTTAAIDNLRIETRKKSKGFLGTGIGSKSQKTEDLASWIKKQKGWEDEDLFDEDKLINAGLAKEVIEKFGDKLVGQTKETLEALIDLREQYDEYLDQLHEYVSSLYEPLVDNVVDSLWDWLDTGKDALDSFKDYASDTFKDIVSDMMRSIVLSKVVDGFDKQVSDLYEKYAKGDIDEQELMKQVAEKTGELVDRYEQNMPTLQEILGTVNGYFKDAGIDLKDKNANSQSSSKAVSVMASQDSIDETNGRLTGIQMAGEEIKVQNVSQSESLNILTVKADAILSVNTDTRNIADEIRTIQVNSYLELQEIRENTGNSAKYLKDIKADMAEVKKNTSGLNSR